MSQITLKAYSRTHGHSLKQVDWLDMKWSLPSGNLLGMALEGSWCQIKWLVKLDVCMVSGWFSPHAGAIWGVFYLKMTRGWRSRRGRTGMKEGAGRWPDGVDEQLRQWLRMKGWQSFDEWMMVGNEEGGREIWNDRERDSLNATSYGSYSFHLAQFPSQGAPFFKMYLCLFFLSYSFLPSPPLSLFFSDSLPVFPIPCLSAFTWHSAVLPFHHSSFFPLPFFLRSIHYLFLSTPPPSHLLPVSLSASIISYPTFIFETLPPI